MAIDRAEWWSGLIVYGGGALFIGGVLWFVTAPSADQVCRQSSRPAIDWLHGVDGQPTCQQLIDQIEAQAARADRRSADLEDRVQTLESRFDP